MEGLASNSSGNLFKNGSGNKKRERRNRKKKRNDDSIRADKSMEEKVKKAALKAIKQEKFSKVLKVGKETAAKPPKKLDGHSLIIAQAQSQQLTNLVPPTSTSTPIATGSGTDVSKANDCSETPKVQIISKTLSSNTKEVPVKKIDKGAAKSGNNLHHEESSEEEEQSEKEQREKEQREKEQREKEQLEKEQREKEQREKEESEKELEDVGANKDLENQSNSAASSSASDSSSTDSDSSSDESEAKKPKKKKPKKLTEEEYLAQLRWHEGDPDTVQLYKTGIYVNDDAYDNLKEKKNPSHSSIARALIEMVFTEQAIMDCSLLGNAQKGPMGATPNSRPGLYPKAVSAIKKVAKKMCDENNIKRDNVVNIHKQMSTKMSEIRSGVKANLLLKSKRELKKKLKEAKKLKKAEKKNGDN